MRSLGKLDAFHQETGDIDKNCKDSRVPVLKKFCEENKPITESGEKKRKTKEN